LFGQCCGDAFGQQVEFLNAQEIRTKFPNGLHQIDDGGTWNLLAGQITDDSELALLLARTVVDQEKYDREKVAQAYAYWFRETAPFDVGNTIGTALRAVKPEHVERNIAAKAMSGAASMESQSNGSLMRISPLGLYGYRMNVDDLWRLACSESALTHPHIVCQQASALYVCAIAHAIESGCSAREVYDYSFDLAQHFNVETILMSALEEAPSNTREMNQQAGWIINAFQNALYQLLHCSSAGEAIINTTALGGDTDTNAAIAGALCGAVFGRDSIPFSWRQLILSCRPHPVIHPAHPRPLCLWPADLTILTERLLLCG
jgi:ADP-ribosylglycohydrolase